MIFRTLLFLFLYRLPLVFMLKHEQPVAQKVWGERCTKNTIALNDCNWCYCNVKNAYTCNARACNEVDMFGHFNDAITEMDVGMDGHGVWRSEQSACEAGVHYRKNDLLCVCTEDGKWPNPICRDIFQVLHSVEITEYQEPSTNQTCSATKLYLYGCNVCFCPSNGQIDPKLCTKRNCTANENIERTHTKEVVEEVYATCTTSVRYKIGCQTCVCLRNNRLLCDNCTVQDNLNMIILQNTVCYGNEPGIVFKQGCNFCQCDKKDTIFCTAKNCLAEHTAITLPKMQYDIVEQSQDDYICVPGSQYQKDCNTCHCFMLDGVKYFGCTMKPCKLPIDPRNDCVENTTYQVNCLICHCVMDGDVKREFCTIDETCKVAVSRSFPALSAKHGYCEPLHFYQQDCNKCRCLADGKTVACTSKICFKKNEKTKSKPVMKSRSEVKETEEPLIMEFIPFVQNNNYCPKGHTYMIDCNVCYCMKTGNAVCTTKQC